jgi:hypothetical protein
VSGRPTKLDDLTAKRIADAVRLGAPWYLAAQAGGVGRSTLREWKAKGDAGEEPYAAFLARLKSAEAEAATEALRVIQNAATNGTWQASAWLLERRYPKSFARRDARAVQPAASLGTSASVSGDDVELFESLAAAARSARGVAATATSNRTEGTNDDTA